MAHLSRHTSRHWRWLPRGRGVAAAAAALLWLLAAPISGAAAAEENDEAQPEPVTERNADAPTDEGSGTQSTSSDEEDKPAPEVFNPTEEISEDLAVAFPVDI